MTEFEIRSQMESIRVSEVSPLRKARTLAKLHRNLLKELTGLRMAFSQVEKTKDLRSQAVLKRITATTLELSEDVEHSARRYLEKAGLSN